MNCRFHESGSYSSQHNLLDLLSTCWNPALHCNKAGMNYIVPQILMDLVSKLFGLLPSLQRDLRKCRQWFVAACLLSILFIVDLMMQAFSMRATTLEILAPLAATLILFYMILVVLVYMDEVRLGGCEQIKSQTEIPT